MSRPRLRWIIGGLVLVLGAVLGVVAALTPDIPTRLDSGALRMVRLHVPAAQSGGIQPDAGGSLDSNGHPLAYAGSPDAASAFLDLLVASNYAAAYRDLTDDLRSQYADTDAFVQDLFAVIGSPGSIATIHSWQMADAYARADHDEIHFFLDTDRGSTKVTVSVTEQHSEMRVCQFESPDGVQVTDLGANQR